MSARLDNQAYLDGYLESLRTLAVDHSRLPFLYMVASNCHTTGRIEAAVRYSDAGETVVIGSGSDEVPYGMQGLLGIAYQLIGQPERSVE